MAELRKTTIIQIESILDRSYFTKDSFTISNRPLSDPFLIISFIPMPQFRFLVSSVGMGTDDYRTDEVPGFHIATGESTQRKGFSNVLQAIQSWVERIREDLRTGKQGNDEVEHILNEFRQKILSHTFEGEEEFTEREIAELRERLDALQTIIEQQSEKLEASDKQIKEFKKEIEDIKKDLEAFPKSVWYKVSGNKLLKSVGKFVKSKEGRDLLIEGIRKLVLPSSE